MHYTRFPVRPVRGESFPVPESTGYQTYGGLLTLLDAGKKGAGSAVHEGDFASLRNSGLLGQFGSNNTYPKHKRVRGDETYEIVLSIIDESDVDLYRALLDAVAIEGEPIPLAHGELTVDGIRTRTTSFDEVLDQATTRAEDAAGVRVEFETMTCIVDGETNEVTTPFPSREKVFMNLQSRWNRAVKRTSEGDPDRQSLALDSETLRNSIYTQGVGPDYRGDWTPVSRVVNRETPETPSAAGIAEGSPDKAETGEGSPNAASQDTAADGGQSRSDSGHSGGRLEHRQGFKGTFEYRFKKGVSTPVRTAVVALGSAAPYLNVGRAVARGPGTVDVEVIE